ncbi:MAG: hypothetical protein J7K85_07790, partial [Anaerolineaceae bacterium]|nr:hypothetical protein [Anaerolineaceae bacterium]
FSGRKNLGFLVNILINNVVIQNSRFIIFSPFAIFSRAMVSCFNYKEKKWFSQHFLNLIDI